MIASVAGENDKDAILPWVSQDSTMTEPLMSALDQAVASSSLANGTPMQQHRTRKAGHLADVG
jgi:hypothetical protein